MADETTEALEDLTPPYTFAVVGDLHFGRPSPQTALSWRATHAVPEDDLFTENVDYALTPMMESLRVVGPAFVLLTGDLYEPGAGKESTDEDVRAVTRFLRSYGLRFLFARGHRDPEAIFLDRLSRTMRSTAGVDVTRTTYTVTIGRSRLVVLDTPAWDEAQRVWLNGVLAQSQRAGVERLFLFGHHPIWPVTRAFYSNRAFCDDLRRLLDTYTVDAYFCGHTHNQSVILHRTGGRPVLQCMAAPIGLPEELPTPLDRVHTFLPDGEDLLLRWSGYLENTAPGWFLVHVGETGVRAEWHHLGRGAEVVAAWNRRGDIQRFWQMSHPSDARLLASDLPNIRRAFLRYCAWDASRPGKRVRLNGLDVGSLPYGSQFAPRRMELPSRALAHLAVLNRLEINAPGVEASTVGNLQIEAVLPGGRVVRTRPTGDIFTWSDRWGSWGTRGLVKIMPGRPIRTVLSFR